MVKKLYLLVFALVSVAALATPEVNLSKNQSKDLMSVLERAAKVRKEGSARFIEVQNVQCARKMKNKEKYSISCKFEDVNNGKAIKSMRVSTGLAPVFDNPAYKLYLITSKYGVSTVDQSNRSSTYDLNRIKCDSGGFRGFALCTVQK